MKRHNTSTTANSRQRPKPSAVIYIRVGTAAQLEEPKTGLEIPARVYSPEAILRMYYK